MALVLPIRESAAKSPALQREGWFGRAAYSTSEQRCGVPYYIGKESFTKTRRDPVIVRPDVGPECDAA